MLDTRLFAINADGTRSVKKRVRIQEVGKNSTEGDGYWETRYQTTCFDSEEGTESFASRNCVTVAYYHFVYTTGDPFEMGPGGVGIVHPDPGTGGGGGQPGGSTGSGPTEPPPCNPNPHLENGLPLCPGSGNLGWTHVFEDPEPVETPCDKAKKAAKKMDSLFTNAKIDSALATIPNFASETKEKGFPIYQNFTVFSLYQDTTFGDYKIGDIQTGTDSSITILLSYFTNREMPVGMVHTHPNIGYNAHSAEDVFRLIEYGINNGRFQSSFVASANGSKYALTITDYTKASAFFATKSHNLTGTKWNENSDIGKAFKNAEDYFKTKVFKNDLHKDNLAYERAMAAVLNHFDTGLTLNKRDEVGNFKPIVIKTSADPNKPKRIIYTQECL